MGRLTSHLIFTLALLLTPPCAKGATAAMVPRQIIGYHPIDGVNTTTIATMDVHPNDTPLQTCGPCTCCSALNVSGCHSKNCCYRVQCENTSPPYGECALRPVVCNSCE